MCGGPVPIVRLPMPASSSRQGQVRALSFSLAGLSPLATTWTFTPTDKNAVVKVTDQDYLSFGYWLSKKEGEPTGFKVWYGGSSDVAATAALVTLNEKVTYTGAAAGKYVIKNDLHNTAQAGYFTADAKLTADFRASIAPVPLDLLDDLASTDTYVGKLSGSISGFKDGDSTPLADLKLTLSGHLSALTTPAVTGTTGPADVIMGSWDHDNDSATPT